MAAPTAVLTHGSAIDLVDEPATSSVIQAEKFNFKGAREERKSRKYDGSTFRLQKRDPHATMTLSGFILGSGLAIQEAGTEVTALANFAATRHGCDPAVGAIILDEVDDDFTIEEDVMINMSMTWWPFL